MSSARKRFNRERVPMGDLYTISLKSQSSVFFFFFTIQQLVTIAAMTMRSN
jgi:hypothetical protein